MDKKFDNIKKGPIIFLETNFLMQFLSNNFYIKITHCLKNVI